MKRVLGRVAAFGLGLAVSASSAVTAIAETPKRGGILEFVVGSKIPSYDGHREATFGMIHPIRPFYSLLIRVSSPAIPPGSISLRRVIVPDQ